MTGTKGSFFAAFLLTVHVWSAAVRADVRLPLIFGDHMVLQQDAKVPVWGWASPDEKVTVTFGGQTVSTAAGADGTWKIQLAPLASSDQGQALTVTGTNTLTFQDVLLGDVWIGSGQSNMEFGINGKKQFAADVDKSDDPLLRLFWVPKTTSLEPLDDILPWPLSYDGQSPASVAQAKAPPDPYRAKWLLCTPEALRKINGQGFATVAYLFAREIRAHTGRPLGMIESCWGGTRAESWTSISGLAKDPPFTRYLQNEQKQMASFAALEATYPKRKADYDAALAQWNEQVGKPLDKEKNAWKAAAQKAIAAGQPPLPEPQPAILRPATVHPPDNDTNTPGNLFNAMISPLIPFAIKGVIWYQGEFNSGYESGLEYATLFPRMISDWREKWAAARSAPGAGDFPFLFVQLPNFGPVDTRPSAEDHGWRWVREAQLKALSLPRTAMAISIDVGDPDNLHPPDKLDVALRLALAARRLVYGEQIVASGPIYDSMKVEKEKVRLTFTNRGSGLVLGVSPYHPDEKPTQAPATQLRGFGIAGTDRNFLQAQAVIDGDTVVVSSNKVPVPVAVRYDFADSPQGNLYNKEGLPASPFRTDDWNDKDK